MRNENPMSVSAFRGGRAAPPSSERAWGPMVRYAPDRPTERAVVRSRLEVISRTRVLSTRTTTEARKPPARAGASLEARALAGVTGIILIAVSASALFAARVIDARLHEATASHAASVGDRLATSSSDALRRNDLAELTARMGEIMRDPRVQFAVVSDTNHNPVGRQVRDHRAYSLHERHAALHPPHRRPLKVAEPLRDDTAVRAFVYLTPIWHFEGGEKRHIGYAAVSFMDPTVASLRTDLFRAVGISAIVAALGATPLVFLGARRLTSPLKRVANAAAMLASGRQPGELPERGAREIAVLAHSFNHMSRSLLAAKESLERANHELEDVVQARTMELAQANHLLRFEVDEKSEFIRSVSHDLSAPLRNIAGMAELLLADANGALSDDARAKIERIRANAQLEQDMLNELLELSRIGVRQECLQRTDVGEVVDEVVRTFEHELEERGIVVDVHRPLPPLLVERARLRHVVQNLIDNAIKYMGDRPVRRIDVSAFVDHAGARLVVADTGPGIPEREQASVFKIFRRASTAMGEPSGKGVGLASVKAMAERWGGSIELESREGNGSRFTVRFPMERVIFDGAGEHAAA